MEASLRIPPPTIGSITWPHDTSRDAIFRDEYPCELKSEMTDGWRYYPVVMSTNGPRKPDFISAGRKEQKHPGGTYYIGSEPGEKNGGVKLVVSGYPKARPPLDYISQRDSLVASNQELRCRTP